MSSGWNGGEDNVSGLPATAVLEAARDAQQKTWEGDVHLLRAAAEWAAAHPEEMLPTEWDHDPGLETDVPIAGPSAPTMCEFAINEFGAFLHLSTPAAKALIGAAVELQHRLPRVWKLLTTGRMAPWQGKLLARHTIGRALTMEAVGWVDRQAGILGGRVSMARLERLVDDAWIRFMAPNDGLDPELGGGVIPDRRHADLDERHIGSDGTLHLDADLDLAGGLDLNHVLTHRAEELKALGSTDSLDVRRAIALCDLARTQTALDLAVGTHQHPATTDDLPPARRLDLTIHLQATVDEDRTVVVDPVATLERNGGIVLMRRTVEEWCRSSRTEVRVLPVLDLNTPRTSPGYRPSPLLQRQVRLRDGTCYFPWCERPAAGCDLDHLEPYDANADRDRPQTRDDNLAPACRRHHRAKTHGKWTVHSPIPGTYLWTSPRGELYLRDARGTTAL